MALRFSTGLRQCLLGGGSMRDAFGDAILQIYSGSAPATADLAATGVLLAEITLASGTVSHDEVGVRMVEALEITYVVENGTNGVTITTTPATTTHTFIRTNPAGPETHDATAVALALLINADPMVPVVAIPYLHFVLLISKFPGEVFVATPTGSTTPPSLTHPVTNTRNEALHLAAPLAGVISKESGVWSKPAVATGTAAYFRLVRTTEEVAPADSSTAIRIQGSISTSGAELNLSNLNIVTGATVTIDVFSLTCPAA